MRRVVLSCVCLAVLLLPAVTSARSTSVGTKPGYLVVRGAENDGGSSGRPAVQLVVTGFVLGSVTQEARVDIYHLPSASPQTLPSAKGQDVSSEPRRYGRHHLPGVEYIGSGFRFSAMGGSYRVVIRGAGIYLFAGGVWRFVKLQGSSIYKNHDGTYSINGSKPLSMPTQPLTRRIGPK